MGRCELRRNRGGQHIHVQVPRDGGCDGSAAVGRRVSRRQRDRDGKRAGRGVIRGPVEPAGIRVERGAARQPSRAIGERNGRSVRLCHAARHAACKLQAEDRSFAQGLARNRIQDRVGKALRNRNIETLRGECRAVAGDDRDLAVSAGLVVGRHPVDPPGQGIVCRSGRQVAHCNRDRVATGICDRNRDGDGLAFASAHVGDRCDDGRAVSADNVH